MCLPDPSTQLPYQSTPSVTEPMGNILSLQRTRSVLCNEITPLVTLCISCEDLREDCVRVCVFVTLTQTAHRPSHQSASVCPAITQAAAGGSGINKQSWQPAWMNSNGSVCCLLLSVKSGPKERCQAPATYVNKVSAFSEIQAEDKGRTGRRCEKRLAFHRLGLRAELRLLS